MPKEPTSCARSNSSWKSPRWRCDRAPRVVLRAASSIRGATSTSVCSGSRRRMSTGKTNGRSSSTARCGSPSPKASRPRRGVAMVDVDDVQAEADRLRDGGRRSGHGARARRPDAHRRRLRSLREPHPARRSTCLPHDPQGLAGRRPVHALDARPRLRLAGERARCRYPADALRRQLGAPGRPRA